MGKINVGKGTFGHITQFVFPRSVSFQHGMWDGTAVLIPKPAPGTDETLTSIVVRVHGRETEVFFEELGPGLVIVTPMKLSMNFGCLKNNNIKGSAACTQLPITPAVAMVVCNIYKD